MHASSFIFDRIILKVAGNQDRHKSSDKFDFGSLVSMTHLFYMFFEMRFDLGTLDSGERLLHFGLLFFFCFFFSLIDEIIFFLQMAEGGFYMQNQLKFNLDVPLSAANIALR